MALFLDAATEKHLDAWLQHQFDEDDRPEKKAAMLNVYAEDPERWADRGWPAVRDEARNRPDTIQRPAERESVSPTTRAQQLIDSFRQWYSSVGHWVYASRQEALDKWATNGIEGLPKAPAEARALLSAWAGLGSTPGPARGERGPRAAIPPGKARCAICGKTGSKHNLAKHEARCKSGDCGHGKPKQASLSGTPTGGRGPRTVSAGFYPAWRSTYSQEAFDRAQAFATELTDRDRSARLPAPAHGYSRERFNEAELLVRAAGDYPSSVTRYREHVIRSDKDEPGFFRVERADGGLLQRRVPTIGHGKLIIDEIEDGPQ